MKIDLKKLILEASDTTLGYKVMEVRDGKIISGADKRQTFNIPKVGDIIKMHGNGIYLGTSKQYVLDYYSELADSEVLITFEFNPNNITFGNLNDAEPEIAVKLAKVVNVEYI